jgi:hypothetical protein
MPPNNYLFYAIEIIDLCRMDFLTDEEIKEEIDKFGTVKDLAVELNLNRSMLNRMKSGTLKINNVYRTLFTLYFNKTDQK